MKKFMYMCMMLLAATLTFTACGSDDDDDNGGGGGQGGSTITADQILGTWYGIDENTSERVNIFAMTFNSNGKGTYTEFKAKAKNNWTTEKESTAMTWTLTNGTLNASIVIDGETHTLKGDLMNLNGNTVKVKRYLGDGETDVITLTRVSGENEVATILNNMANEKKQGGQGGGGNEVNEDNLYTYTATATVPDYGDVIVTGTATFENGVCTSISFTYTYPSKSLAKNVWESYLEDAEEDEDWAEAMQYYSYDGNKSITYQMPAEGVKQYASAWTKAQICAKVKEIVEANVQALNAINDEE